ncbi:MAG TPA: XRE family transcriptional regulator [Phycisphaerae bacterium]|nr:XRE family transcriptional regulator [Phycisphaerae bacterium]
MIGERLRQARLAAAMTQDQVVVALRSHGASLTKAGLSKYERGGSVPAPNLLMKLARVLRVRPDYFVQDPQVSIAWLGFRKRATLGKRRQDRIKAVVADAVTAQVWLEEKLFPKKATAPLRPQKVNTLKKAEVAAGRVRQAWHLGDQAIESMTEVIEDRRGVVVECAEEVGEFDGLAGWANASYPVVAVSGAVSVDRRRFNLAHELGHLAICSEGLDSRRAEELAYRFAAAFIVPAHIAYRELGKRRRTLTLGELAILKQKHGLSMQAWARRAFDLGIITRGHYAALCRHFSAKGWRKQEPVAFEGSERPRRLGQLTLRALAEGIIGPDRAEELCPGCTKDLPPLPGKPTSEYTSPLEIRRLPAKTRDKLLARAAGLLQEDYREDKKLTGFEAHSEEDLHDESLKG